MADDLVKRLQDNVADILDWNGKVMTAWDTVRAMIAKGNKGSLPRDIMESYLSGYAEDMAEAADRIEKLEAALKLIAQNNYGLQGMMEDGTDTPEAKAEYYAGQVSRRQNIARKALEGKDD